MQRLLWILAAVLFFAVAAVAWHRVGPLLYPDVALVAAVAGGCDLRAGPCTASFPDGSEVTFEIRPHRIPVAQPLLLRAEIRGIEARRVEVDFAGVDMNMGFNRVALQPMAGGGTTGDRHGAGGGVPRATRENGEGGSRKDPAATGAAADSRSDGAFGGTGMLPVCVRARMTWEARVLLHTDAGILAAPFRFDTFLAHPFSPTQGPPE